MSDQPGVKTNVTERRAGARAMVSVVVVVAIVAVVAVLTVAGAFARRSGPAIALAAEGAAWSQEWNDAVRRSRDSGKPALVLFTADWCPACRWFESNALALPDVRAYAESNYTPITVDLSEPGGPNDALARRFDISALPTLVAYDGDGREVARANTMAGDQLLAWLRKNRRAPK